MKRNFKLKFLITLTLITLFCAVVMPLTTFAMNSGYMDPEQFDDPSYDLVSQNVPNSKFNVSKFLTQGLGVILTLVRIVALAWAVIMAFSIAFKYMTGSAQIKSQLKTDLPTYVIGAVVLFGGAGVITLIQYFVEDTFKV